MISLYLPLKVRRLFRVECLYCKSKMQRETAPFSIHRGSYHLSWDAIPAWICHQCGETLFEAHEVDLIQEALCFLDTKFISAS